MFGAGQRGLDVAEGGPQRAAHRPEPNGVSQWRQPGTAGEKNDRPSPIRGAAGGQASLGDLLAPQPPGALDHREWAGPAALEHDLGRDHKRHLAASAPVHA